MSIYGNQTFEVILNRLLNALPNDLDKREGSILYDLLAPVAIEITQQYIELDNVLTLSFANTTYGEYLDMRAGEVGLTRREATPALGKVTFTGKVGQNINIGTRISTKGPNALYFVTTEAGVIGNDKTLTLAVEAEEAGAEGNVASGSITVSISSLSGILSVTNTQPLTGGTDEETDDELLERYFERMQKPQTTGNANDYVKWAKEIDGVGEVKVFPLWNGNGTVKVVVVDTESRTPSQPTLDKVAEHIEELRPIGASVTVAGAWEHPINMTADLIIEEGYTLDDAKAEIEDALVDYYASIAFKSGFARYNYIGNIILDCVSVMDFKNLLVNGGTTNTIISSEQIPVVGNMVFTEVVS